MPIAGLETILRNNCLNFEPLLLCKTKAVISGMDFAGVIISKTRTSDQKYGGEYLAYYIKLKECITRLQQCQITPYFIFSGTPVYLGNQFQSLLRKRAKPLMSPDKSDGCFPPRLKGVTIEALRENGTPFQILHNSTIRDAAAVAEFMDCPLLANTSDCYILASSVQLQNKSKQGSIRPLIPLYLTPIDSPPVDCLDSTTSAIPAHAFRAECSELKTLCPAYRILAGILLGSDSLPASQLPLDAHASMICRDRSLHPKQRRWLSVVEWLSKFPPDSEEPIQQIIAANAGNDNQAFIKQLAESILCYIFRPDTVGRRLTEVFEKRCTDIVETISENLNIFSLDEDIFTHQDITSLLQGRIVPKLEPADFTSGWPVRLIHAYRFANVISSFFTPLYSHGSILTDRIQCRSLEFSVHEPSLPIRLMHYRIMVGLERQLGGCAKLVGLNPHATEYVRRGQRFVSYVIPVTALMINLSQDHTDRVLSAFLGTNLPTASPEPEWIFGLAVSVAFWYRHFTVAQHEQQLDSLECCSVVLAVFACAAASMTETSMDAELLHQYESLIEALTEEPDLLPSTFSKDGDPDPSCFHIIHYLTSIQILYDSFKSLICLIESILPITHESQVFHFPPPWAIFPSSKLICAVALHLDSLEPAMRRHATLNYWLPRLHRSPKVSTTKSSFNQLLDISLSLQLPSRNVKYTLNAVDIPLLPPSAACSPPGQPIVDNSMNHPTASPWSRISPRHRGTPGRGTGPRAERKSSGPKSSSGDLAIDSPSPNKNRRGPSKTPIVREFQTPLTDSNGNQRRGTSQVRRAVGRFPRKRGESDYGKRLRDRLGDLN